MKNILLKLSGQLFTRESNGINQRPAILLADQLKELISQGYFFSIVIGGGNFFRGGSDGKQLNMERSSADSVGMLATIMNGIIIQDIFLQRGIATKLLSAIPIPGIGDVITPLVIAQCQQAKISPIFVGGTGCPYFSTDTNAVVRALQVGATEVWKATNVDGLYSDDPTNNPQATLVPQITFQEAITKKLRVMDTAALSLALEHRLLVRIFNATEQNSLLKAAADQTFGSIITI